jgi:hypothetical protein
MYCINNEKKDVILYSATDKFCTKCGMALNLDIVAQVEEKDTGLLMEFMEVMKGAETHGYIKRCIRREHKARMNGSVSGVLELITRIRRANGLKRSK